MPSAMLLMLVVKLKQVLFYSLNRNIHCVQDDNVYNVIFRAKPSTIRLSRAKNLKYDNITRNYIT